MSDEMQIYDDALSLTPVMDIKLAKARLEQFQEFIKGYLIEDEDYGIIPGTQKPTLYKPGGDKLCELYGLTDSYQILDKTIDFNSGLFDYDIQCQLTSRRTGLLVSTGLGSCSSFEGKYRWREGKRTCPQCGAATIFASKNDPGFYCWMKKGGCGAKFAEDDESITSQPLSIKIENDDFATLKNTILKMAKKRAKIDATLSATRSSGIFSQDIGDDDDRSSRGRGQSKPQTQRAEPQRRSAVKPQEGAEAYLTELKAAQWVSQEKHGWITHAVKGFLDAGGAPERVNEITLEAVGVASPNLVKDDKASVLVKALEDAAKLGSAAPKKAEPKKTAAKPDTAKPEAKPEDAERKRIHINELLDALVGKGFKGNAFDLIDEAGGARKVKDVPDEKLDAVEAKLTEELSRL